MTINCVFVSLAAPLVQEKKSLVCCEGSRRSEFNSSCCTDMYYFILFPKCNYRIGVPKSRHQAESEFGFSPWRDSEFRMDLYIETPSNQINCNIQRTSS